MSLFPFDPSLPSHRFQRVRKFGLGHILALSVPEEVIDTDTKPSNPTDWTEHLLRVCMSVCVFNRAVSW